MPNNHNKKKNRGGRPYYGGIMWQMLHAKEVIVRKRILKKSRVKRAQQIDFEKFFETLRLGYAKKQTIERVEQKLIGMYKESRPKKSAKNNIKHEIPDVCDLIKNANIITPNLFR